MFDVTDLLLALADLFADRDFLGDAGRFLDHGFLGASVSHYSTNYGIPVNIEEPDAFNREVWNFIALVEAGKWTPGDPAALGASLI